ncbi:hypothetical protein GCM10022291_15860 [Postechiella marina]|uniref:Secretion system C-terminal sorting domain-containing protein n=1 Tax=Postechiella marina TaxID=943941 RepID=A0ABP8C821_9FLAO
MKKITLLFSLLTIGLLSAQTPSVTASPGVGGSITQIGPDGNGGFIFFDASNNPVTMTVTGLDLANSGSGNDKNVYLSVRQPGGTVNFGSVTLTLNNDNGETNVEDITFDGETITISDRDWTIGANEVTISANATNTLQDGDTYWVWARYFGPVTTANSMRYGEVGYPAYGNSDQSFTVTYNAGLTLSNKSFNNANIAKNIYPNPVSSTLNVSNSINTKTYKIVNLLGKTIKDVEANGSIDVSDLSSGIYILATDAGKAKFVKK